MSRVANNPITLPKGVEVTLGGTIAVHDLTRPEAGLAVARVVVG